MQKQNEHTLTKIQDKSTQNSKILGEFNTACMRAIPLFLNIYQYIT